MRAQVGCEVCWHEDCLEGSEQGEFEGCGAHAGRAGPLVGKEAGVEGGVEEEDWDGDRRGGREKRGPGETGRGGNGEGEVQG